MNKLVRLQDIFVYLIKEIIKLTRKTPSINFSLNTEHLSERSDPCTLKSTFN